MKIHMTFEKPYYLVTIISKLKPIAAGYEEMAEKMLDLSNKRDGFLGKDLFLRWSR